MNKLWFVIPAGGTGSRMGANLPKQYLPLNDHKGGQCVLHCTINQLLSLSFCDHLFVGIAEGDDYFGSYIRQYVNTAKNNDTVLMDAALTQFKAGEERVNTVISGLNAIVACEDYDKNKTNWVLVHDAARPCVSAYDIEQLIDYCLSCYDKNTEFVGAILANPMVDTTKLIQPHGHNRIKETIDRKQLICATTPQMFRLEVLLSALQSSMAENTLSMITDESSAIEQAGLAVDYVMARDENPKITYSPDLAYAQWLFDECLKSGCNA